MSEQSRTTAAGQSRRDFVKGASAIVAGSAVLGLNARIARSANVLGSDEIKVALIGSGGRGRGAAEQLLATEGKVRLVAVADVFENRVNETLSYLHQAQERAAADGNEVWKGSAIDVPKDRQFIGFDAYQHALQTDADLVVLATPPGFRPLQFEAAVNAGKHIFMEKPVAVDANGIRRVMAANDVAKEKELMVAVGFQRRHDPRYVEAMAKIHDGAIGDILATRVYWNGGGLWMYPRLPEYTEMEYQLRNWYYFTWICGDHIVEQHVHNLDIGNWLRKDKHPVEAQGMGGRQVRTGREYGHIFDHHCVEFTYEDGTKMFSQCRHIDGTTSDVSEHAHATKGTADLDDGAIGPVINGADGKWRSRERKRDNHHQEQKDLMAALRKGERYNEADYGANSTMTAIMGRMATYSGKTIKWDEAINGDHDLSPERYAMDADPPVLPDQDGFYPVAVPGKTDPMKC